MITEDNALKTLIKTKGFFEEFSAQLNDMFPRVYDCTKEVLDNLASSAGWSECFASTCSKFNLTEVEKFYCHLPWEQSDIFDARVAELTVIMCSKEDSKIKCYTSRWNNFQIRDVVYIDGHIDPNKFDIVRWYTHEPVEVIDATTGRCTTSKESCYTVATLEYSPVDNSFELHSCSMRFLNDYVEGLCEWVLDWCNEYIKEHA